MLRRTGHRIILCFAFLPLVASLMGCTPSQQPAAPIIPKPTHTIERLVNHDPPLFDEPVIVEGFYIRKPISLLCPVLPANPVRINVGDCLTVSGVPGSGFDFPKHLHRKWVRASGLFDADTCPPNEICVLDIHPKTLAQRERVFGPGVSTFRFRLRVEKMERVSEKPGEDRGE